MFKIDGEESEGSLLYEVQALRQDVAAQTKLTEELLQKLDRMEKKMDTHEHLIKRLATCIKIDTKEKSIKLKLFPIVSEEQLRKVERIVENSSKESVMQYLRQQLLNVKKSKIFSIVFTEDMLLQVNWNGVKNKLPLNRNKLFSEHIYECLKTNMSNMSYDRYEDMMKRSLVLGKNSIYKKVHKLKYEQ